jgi:hypothetical protein
VTCCFRIGATDAGNCGPTGRSRASRLEELRCRWDEEHEKLKELVRTYRQKASYYSDVACGTKWRSPACAGSRKKVRRNKFPGVQNGWMRLPGGHILVFLPDGGVRKTAEPV